jgi:2,3-dihydroxyethylbenzene 1,2-dioxygenase
VEAAVRFYTEGLGLVGGIDYVFRGPRRTVTPQFFHTPNDRHHSCAFGIGPLDKRMHHFMVETTSIDDVGIAHDEVTRREIPVTLPLGKHANDQMLSFYLVSPSGFQIEYGSGGRPPPAEAEYSIKDMWGRPSIGGR